MFGDLLQYDFKDKKVTKDDIESVKMNQILKIKRNLKMRDFIVLV